jgi:hypothetical protein
MQGQGIRRVDARRILSGIFIANRTCWGRCIMPVAQVFHTNRHDRCRNICGQCTRPKNPWCKGSDGRQEDQENSVEVALKFATSRQ